jgi:hypothetical protein
MNALGSRLLTRAMALSLLLICGLVAARAEDITFRIAVFPDSGLEGWIYVKESGKAWEKTYPVPSVGTLKVSRVCAVGTLFQAHVSDDYTLVDRPNGDRACVAGEIKFLFREKVYATQIRKALSGQALEGAVATGEIVNLQSQLSAAFKKNDDEYVMKSSSDIYNRLIKSKNFAAAEPYRILNLDKAKARINGGELFLDPATKRYVLNEQDEQLIMKIQQQNNISQSGKLDWPTMESIARYTSADLM